MQCSSMYFNVHSLQRNLEIVKKPVRRRGMSASPVIELGFVLFENALCICLGLTKSDATRS
jgi:hypothetical protein